MTVLVAGHLNLETSAPVEAFPVDYVPARYPTGIRTVVSGVGWNVASALEALGTPVRLLAPVGDDLAGRLIREAIEAAHLDAVVVPTERTPQSVILHDPTGRRAILTDTADVDAAIVPTATLRRVLEDCDVAVLSNVNWTRGLLAPTRAAGVPVATDLHAVAGLDNPYDAEYIDNADILFLSGEALPEPPERFAGRVLARSAAEIVGIGLGERGALVATRSADPVVVPAPDLRPVVSTTGAGDALLAAFLHFHRRPMPPEEAMLRAVVFASWTVGAQGGSEGFLAEAALEELLTGL